MSNYAHQDAGIERIAADGYIHGLLWDIGTGKSRTVVKALERLCEELQRPIRVLIVAPKSVQRTWMSQFEQHCDLGFCVGVLDGPIKSRLGTMSNWETPADINVAVVGYSTFAARQNKDAVLKAVKAMKPDVMVCDEGHALRGLSNTAKLIARVGRLVPRRLLLTGTPMPLGPQDLYMQWAYLDPEVWTENGRFLSHGAWLQKYAVMGGFQGKQIVGWKDLDTLNTLVANKSSTVSKSECLDLPPTTTTIVRYDLSDVERAHYEDMKRYLLTVVEDDTVTAANKVVAMLRLRQIASGFLPLEDGSVKEIGNTRHVMALELIENILASENRVVVFGWSKHELHRLSHSLKHSPPWGSETEVMLIDGSTSQATRDSYLQHFGSSAKRRLILVANVGAVNAGVNELAVCSHAIFMSMTHNRADHVQAMGRLDRPGQTRPVNYWMLAADRTVDLAILTAHEGKATLEQALLSHVKARTE